MQGTAAVLVVALALLYGPSQTAGKSDPGIVDVLVTTVNICVPTSTPNKYMGLYPFPAT